MAEEPDHVKDPLDLLGDLPDYPGGTPPKNRAGGKGRKPKAVDDYLNGARSKTFRVGGEDREFFTIGELGRAIRRQPVTIRMWEQRGWIPKANFRTPAPKEGPVTKGRRLYSREQVEFLVALVEGYRLDDPKQADWHGFRKHVRQSWPTT